MIYTSEELQRLHEIELDILREVIRVCEENEISYFTFGGTTLGVVRHKGFIPWDDDVDIGMLRSDYDRFVSIAPKALKKGYFLQHYSTEKNTATYFAKVRKDNTEFIESHTKNIKEHHGIFVDIMPFDRVPENDGERAKHSKKIRFLEQLFISKTVWKASSFHGDKKKPILTLIRSCMHILLLPVPRKCLFNKLDRELQKYSSANTDMWAFRAWSPSECYESDLFPVQKMPFESITVSVPNNADGVLKTNYGDYMKLPPVEKRIGHAPHRMSFDTERK